MPGCGDFTPETCPCNVHSAARMAARAAKPVQPTTEVRGLEDTSPEGWEFVDTKAPKDRIPLAALYRLPVPGGWMYAHWVGDNCGPMTFVPHPL